MANTQECLICTAPIWLERSIELGVCRQCRVLVGPMPASLSARRRAVIDERLGQLDEDIERNT